VWRAASPLPIYGKSPCGAEGGEKAGFPQELDDDIFIKLIYSILRFQKRLAGKCHAEPTENNSRGDGGNNDKTLARVIEAVFVPDAFIYLLTGLTLLRPGVIVLLKPRVNNMPDRLDDRPCAGLT
jgi:hypothetical protein